MTLYVFTLSRLQINCLQEKINPLSFLKRFIKKVFKKWEVRFWKIKTKWRTVKWAYLFEMFKNYKFFQKLKIMATFELRLLLLKLRWDKQVVWISFNWKGNIKSNWRTSDFYSQFNQMSCNRLIDSKYTLLVTFLVLYSIWWSDLSDSMQERLIRPSLCCPLVSVEHFELVSLLLVFKKVY